MNDLDNLTMKKIVVYMDDDLREKVHFQFAPCSNRKFILEYYKLLENKEEFSDLLLNEFGIDIDDLMEEMTK